MSTITSANSPDYVRDEVKAVAPDLQLIADLLGGTRAMQESPQLARYLPQWPDEKDTTWARRTRAGTLFEGLGRTVSAATGMLFQAPPVVTYPVDEEKFAAHWLDIDGLGTKGDVFAKRFAESAIAFGHALVLVDFPETPGAPVTAATEAEMNLRARWALYPRQSILSWRIGVVRNRLVPTQVVLYEPATKEDGLYGVTAVQRYRVCAVREGVAGYVVWEKPSASVKEWTKVAEGTYRNRRGETRDTLPIAVAYAGRTDAPMTSHPPLQGCAYANLAHFRNKTELQWGSGITAIEQLVISGALAVDSTTGLPATGVKTGWEHYIHTEQGATVDYKGPSGAGLNQLKDRMLEAEKEIAALGMSFLSRDTRSAETAEAKRLDATAENSTLATAAQGIEDALNLAWSHHAWYEGVADADAPSLVLNRDFERLVLDAAQGSFIAALVAEGFPIRDAVQMLAVGGLLHTTDAAELDRIAAEWEGGQGAAQDLQALASGMSAAA